MRMNLALILIVWLGVSVMATAQTEPSSTLPDTPGAAPAAQPAWHSPPKDSYLYGAGGFCGIGASTSLVATKPTFGCGAGMTLLPLPIFIEFGVMGPQANRSYLSGYLSLDGNIPLARTTVKYLPLAVVGYSRLFETGHALDYGIAVAMPRFTKPKDESSMRIELRDYYTFASPTQHNVMLRIGWMVVEHD